MEVGGTQAPPERRGGFQKAALDLSCDHTVCVPLLFWGGERPSGEAGGQGLPPSSQPQRGHRLKAEGHTKGTDGRTEHSSQGQHVALVPRLEGQPQGQGWFEAPSVFIYPQFIVNLEIA